MKIRPFISPHEQMCRIGKLHWSCARLFELSRDLPVMDIPLAHLNINYGYDDLNLRDMVMHMRSVLGADMEMPIILDENGDIMDGRHRVMRALLEDRETIKAVRFEENPSPCRIDN